MTATISENAAPQVTQLSLESCVGSSFGAPVALPGTPYPVGSNNGVDGADAIEQAVLANNIAPPGQPLRLYFAAQGQTSDDLLGVVGSPLLFNLWPTGEWRDSDAVGMGFAGTDPAPAGCGDRGTIPVCREAWLGILLVGKCRPTVWAAGFLLDGQVNDWQGVPAHWYRRDGR